MRNEPVVADPASQLKCALCETSSPDTERLADNMPSYLPSYLQRHLCGSCGSPRPLMASEDIFLVFGLDRRFAVDTGLLEKRFYEISRLLHPDRFAALGGEVRRLSVERMTFVNDSYNSLKDSRRRREWLLSSLQETQASPESARKPQLPPELAEAWFELQDLEGQAASDAIEGFEKDLQAALNESENRIRQLENNADLGFQSGTPPAPETLLKIREELLSQSYFSSLRRDVERLKKRLFIA